MIRSLLPSLLYFTLPVMLARAAEVSVHVTDPHNTPIPSATISLISRNGGQSRSLSTDGLAVRVSGSRFGIGWCEPL